MNQICNVKVFFVLTWIFLLLMLIKIKCTIVNFHSQIFLAFYSFMVRLKSVLERSAEDTNSVKKNLQLRRNPLSNLYSEIFRIFAFSEEIPCLILCTVHRLNFFMQPWWQNNCKHHTDFNPFGLCCTKEAEA